METPNNTNEKEVNFVVAEPSLRLKLFYLMENKHTSHESQIIRIMGRIYLILLLVCTFLVMASFMASTLPQFYRRPHAFLLYTEYVTMTIFTLDYLIRFILAPAKLPWTLDLLNIVDLFTVLPFWVEIAISLSGSDPILASGLLRAVRITRIFRVVKLTSFSQTAQLCLEALFQCKEAFLLMIVSVLIVVILMGGCVFFFEQTVQTFDRSSLTWYRKDGSVSPFQSIFSACWWGVVTMTTVGYGDVVPVSAGGRLIASFTALFGILVFAFPLSIFSTKFYAIYSKSQVEDPLPTRQADWEELPQLITDLKNKQKSLHQVLGLLKDHLKETDDHLSELATTIQEIGTISLKPFPA